MRVRVLRSIHDISAAVWDGLCTETIFSHGWFSALEESRCLEVEPRHLVLEQDGRPTAILPCFIQRGDPFFTIAQRLWGPLAGPAQRIGLRLMPALLAYSPLAHRTALFAAPGADISAAVAAFRAAMDSLCREEKLACSGFPFVDGRDAALVDALQKAGYGQAFLCPSAAWENRYASFGQFLERLKRVGRHRYKTVRNELNQSERSGVRISEEPLSAIDDDTLARLHAIHARRKSGRSSAGLPSTFFAALKRHLGSLAVVHTARDNECLLSYSIVLKGQSRWHMFLSGETDVSSAHAAKQHFALNYYFPMRLAVDSGARLLDFGMSTYAAKLERGCSLSPMHVFLRSGAASAPWQRPLLRLVDARYRVKYRDVMQATATEDWAAKRGPWWQRWTEAVVEFRTFVVTSHEPAATPQTPPSPAGMMVRKLAPNEVARLQQTATPSRWQLFQSFAERGYACYGAWIDERPAAYWWICEGREHTGRFFSRIPLKADEAFSGFIYVYPEFRGQQVALAIRREVDALLAERGIRCVYAGTLNANLASLKSAARCGVLPLRIWLYRRIGPFAWRRAMPLLPDHPMRKLFTAERQRSGLRPFHAQAPGDPEVGWSRRITDASPQSTINSQLWTPNDPLWLQAWRAWRAYGWRNIARKAWARTAGSVAEHARLIELVVFLEPNRVWLSPPVAVKPEIRQLRPDELGLLRPVTSRSMYALFEQFVRDGFVCYAALIQGRIVGYNWYTEKPYRSRFTHITHPVGPGELYLVYSHTLRDWRGKAIDFFLKLEVMAQLQQQGLRAIRTLVEDTNRTSLRGAARVGFIPERQYIYRRWLGWRKTVSQPLVASPETLMPFIGKLPRPLFRLAEAVSRES